MMMEVGIQDQPQEEIVELITEGSSSANVLDLAASNSTIQSSSSGTISVNSRSTPDNFVLLELFERVQAHTPIVQKIFLYLDLIQKV